MSERSEKETTLDQSVCMERREICEVYLATRGVQLGLQGLSKASRVSKSPFLSCLLLRTIFAEPRLPSPSRNAPPGEVIYRVGQALPVLGRVLVDA